MGENEKLWFTCEEVPLDFRTFNRFFGTTTDWVDEGSSVVPKVPRDNLYPPMSPSPLKDDTQVWNGSQMPSAEYYAKASSSDAKFLAPPNYPQLLAVCEDIKKELLQELGSNPHKVVFNTPNCKVSYKDDKIVVDELTTISEDRAQMLDEAFKNVRKAVGGFPIFTLISKRKARKHYKPKFTL